MNTIVRTAIAILCGFLAMTLIVMSGTIVVWTVLVAKGASAVSAPETPLPAIYLGANQLLTLVAGVVGGWLASRLDPEAGWRPIIGVTVLVVIMSVANQAVPRSSTGAPVPWYPWLLVVAGGAGTLLGGWLRLRQRQAVIRGEASTSGTAESYS